MPSLCRLSVIAFFLDRLDERLGVCRPLDLSRAGIEVHMSRFNSRHDSRALFTADWQ
ncbi:MAG: hypothetical protein WD273_08255 [Trueperaceae bacterium]